MNDELHINGQTFCVVRVAANQVAYSKDYITRLAREQKIRAVRIGRNWYVDVAALAQYAEVQKLETEAHNRQLQHQRKLEFDLRESISKQHVAVYHFQTQWAVYAVMTTCFIALLGFAVGAGLSQVNMLASVSTAVELAPVVTSDSEQPILVPEFTDNQGEATVANGRQILTPATETDWLRIRYD